VNPLERDPELFLAAGRRFAQRVPEHKRQLPAGLSARASFLSKNLARERSRSLSLEADAAGSGGGALAIVRSLSQERVLGTPDIMDIHYLELAIAVARGVARMRLARGFGTGFLVGPDLLMTNNHVLGSPQDAAMATAEFDYQDNSDGVRLPLQSFRLHPDRLFATNRELDVSIVAVNGLSQQGALLGRYPWVKLIATLGKAAPGEAINVIQHPKGGLKQISFRNNQVIEIPKGKNDFLYYTTDTEPGSSGSPCFNDQWEVVALHHSAVPRMKGKQVLKKDGTPWRQGRDDPDDIDWIANEGIRVSAIVALLKALKLEGPAKEMIDEALDGAVTNPIEVARKAVAGGSADPGIRSRASAGAMNWTIPLTLTITTGGTGISGGVAVPEQQAPAVITGQSVEEEALPVDPDWASRQGYIPGFLEWTQEIPLPRLSSNLCGDSVEVPEEFRRDPAARHVLNYHHYSVVMRKSRRMALYSAAIVDGDRRHKLPKRSDKWRIDPRIDDPKHPLIQMGEELYAAAKTDRGHLTRYLDVAWGDTLDQALKALADTFHFTNCALQISGFNQSLDRWQGLERFLLEEHARKQKRRIIVMTGPLFRPQDPLYRNEHMSYRARIPISFWKVCVIVRRDGTLSATGFVMDQDDIAQLPGFEETFDVIATQRTLVELEMETGLDFGFLKEHDHLAHGGDPGTLEIQREAFGKVKRKPILTPADIVV
jgi:endonuclease G